MVGYQHNDAGTLLEVRDLRTHFMTRRGLVQAVNGVNFELEQGETLAWSGSPAPARPSPVSPSSGYCLAAAKSSVGRSSSMARISLRVPRTRWGISGAKESG